MCLILLANTTTAWDKVSCCGIFTISHLIGCLWSIWAKQEMHREFLGENVLESSYFKGPDNDLTLMARDCKDVTNKWAL